VFVAKLPPVFDHMFQIRSMKTVLFMRYAFGFNIGMDGRNREWFPLCVVKLHTNCILQEGDRKLSVNLALIS
jgi:hypothetical protein